LLLGDESDKDATRVEYVVNGEGEAEKKYSYGYLMHFMNKLILAWP